MINADTTTDERDRKEIDYALGIDFKQVYNFQKALNVGWNVYSGLHLGDEFFGLSLDATCRILTQDLMYKDLASQWYVGPNAGFTAYINNGFHPRMGVAFGWLWLIPGSKKYPEADLTFEVAGGVKNGDELAEEFLFRILYHVYLF